MSAPGRDYAELIERLEKATGPRGALDVAIWEALIADPAKHRRTPTGRPRYSDWESLHDDGEWHPFYPSLNTKAYTTSLDAALSLLRDDWHLIRLSQLSPTSWIAEVGENIRDDLTCEAEAATGPLALAIAVVRASSPPLAEARG